MSIIYLKGLFKGLSPKKLQMVLNGDCCSSGIILIIKMFHKLTVIAALLLFLTVAKIKVQCER
jgi:hypothetical protein